jgi:hypothetical protein
MQLTYETVGLFVGRYQCKGLKLACKIEILKEMITPYAKLALLGSLQ